MSPNSSKPFLTTLGPIFLIGAPSFFLATEGSLIPHFLLFLDCLPCGAGFKPQILRHHIKARRLLCFFNDFHTRISAKRLKVCRSVTVCHPSTLCSSIISVPPQKSYNKSDHSRHASSEQAVSAALLHEKANLRSYLNSYDVQQKIQNPSPGL